MTIINSQPTSSSTENHVLQHPDLVKSLSHMTLSIPNTAYITNSQPSHHHNHLLEIPAKLENKDPSYQLKPLTKLKQMVSQFNGQISMEKVEAIHAILYPLKAEPNPCIEKGDNLVSQLSQITAFPGTLSSTSCTTDNNQTLLEPIQPRTCAHHRSIASKLALTRRKNANIDIDPNPIQPNVDLDHSDALDRVLLEVASKTGRTPAVNSGVRTEWMNGSSKPTSSTFVKPNRRKLGKPTGFLDHEHSLT